MTRISFNTIYALWRREMTRLRRSPSRIVGSLAMPLFFLVFLGFGFSSLDLGGIPASIDYIQYLVPGIIGMTMLFSSSFAGLSVLWDKEHGFLKEVMVAPSSRLSIVLGRIAGGGTMSIIQGLMIMILSLLFGFQINSLVGIPIALVFLGLISVTFIGMGMIFASNMHDAQGFGLVMNLVIFPLFFLSGALYPVQNLPLPLQYLAHINPLTYGIDGLRASLIGVSSYSTIINLAALTFFAAVLVGLGTYYFNRMEVS